MGEKEVLAIWQKVSETTFLPLSTFIILQGWILVRPISGKPND